MPGNEPSSDKTWRYHFIRKAKTGEEIETGDFAGDEAAIARAHELASSMLEPIVVERYGVVSWHYVDEIDERP